MFTRHGRFARRISTWKAEMATKRAMIHLDDRLREDAGLPKRRTEPHSRENLLFPYLHR